MTEKEDKHGKNPVPHKAGDRLRESGLLSTGQGNFQKLFIFQGQSESRAAHSIQTQASA